NSWDNVLISYEDKAFTEENILLADSNFFEFFNFKLIEGDPSTALTGVNKIVVSEDAAIKYFNWQGPGDTSPLGKIIHLGTGDRTCEVTGIVENMPSNSHIPYDMVFSMVSWDQSKSTAWVSNNFYTYFKKRPDVPIEETQEKLNGLVKKYVGPQLEQFLGKSLEQFEKEGDIYKYFTQPMSEIHLYSDYEAEFMPGGNISYLIIFGAIALFIVLLACINFMNLSTARSASRAKEVGIRKTVGASRLRLSAQFLSESVLFSVISVIPTLILVYIFLGPFNTISGKQLDYGIFLDFRLYLIIFGLAIFIGILAGSYPALYLTSFRPAEVLKGKVRMGMKSSGVRSILVVFQFFISITLIICTLIVFKQLKMLQNKDLGFEKENVLVIDNANKLGDQKKAFRNELIKYNEIVNASISQSVPPNINNNTVFRPEGTEQDQLMYLYLADENHLATLGYTMSDGRFFSKENPADSMALLLNEAAMKQIEWKEIEGKRIRTFFYTETGDYFNVIGVIKDFNYESLKENVRPLAFAYSDRGNYISVRLSKGNVNEKVKFIEEKWNEFTNNSPFQYKFIDEEFDALFKEEQRFGSLSIVFTGLAIFIACLGLFALATFMSEQRAKEISIRKVMGASSNLIVMLLSKDFTRLVVISFLLSIPISYYFMDQWLQGFAYKTDIGYWSFILAGGGAILISLLTVGFQSFKAAIGNPVN
ncbi:MAG: ABC transporter permease, partial [Cyclobacteriaceae bacterium]|nr:ABC transporter permease [Cyclobacteriaceae bacterium]